MIQKQIFEIIRLKDNWDSNELIQVVLQKEKDKRKDYALTYRENNRDGEIRRTALYRKNHPEEIRKRNAFWRAKYGKEYYRKYYLKRKEAKELLNKTNDG